MCDYFNFWKYYEINQKYGKIKENYSEIYKPNSLPRLGHFKLEQNVVQIQPEELTIDSFPAILSSHFL